jgi:hypothetical protein
VQRSATRKWRVFAEIFDRSGALRDDVSLMQHFGGRNARVYVVNAGILAGGEIDA